MIGYTSHANSPPYTVSTSVACQSTTQVDFYTYWPSLQLMYLDFHIYWVYHELQGEPKYTTRMAIANGTCVSFCNQPKAQFGYIRRVTPVCRCLHPFCGWRHLATSRESKAHFGLPGYAPGTIAVSVIWMERGFNACQTHRALTHLSSTVSQ